MIPVKPIVYAGVFVALLAGVILPVQADSRYTLRADLAQSSPGTPAISMTVSQQGGAQRWDMTIPQADSPQTMSMLMPANTHRVLTIMPDTKTYAAFPLAIVPPDPFGIPFVLMARSMPSTSEANDAPGKMTTIYRIRDLGPASVGGTKTEHYAVTLHLQLQNAPENADTTMSLGLWLAPGKGADTEAERLTPIETVRMGSGATVVREIKGDAKALATMAGRMPVKMTISVDDQVIVFTLSDHSAGSLATSVFQIPAGYQEITPDTAPPPAPRSVPAIVKPQ
jgi:hypothetical protein